MTIKKIKKTASQELENQFGTVTIGDLLKAERTEYKIKKAVLAKRLGITQKELSDIENGYTIPCVEFAKQAAKQVGSSPNVWTTLLYKQLERKKIKK